MNVREWRSVDTAPGRSTVFSIMSYNILCDNYIEPDLYPDIDISTIMLNKRKDIIQKEIQECGADIICLQEIDRFNEIWLPWFRSLGYDGVFVRKTSCDGRLKDDGCATFYRIKKFRCVSYCACAYSMCPMPRPRDHVAVIALLQLRRDAPEDLDITDPPPHFLGVYNTERSLELHKFAEFSVNDVARVVTAPHGLPTPVDDYSKYKPCICVANTHILFNHSRGYTKLNQLETMTDAITSAYGAHVPVLFVGDYNATPYSDLYFFILNGYLPFRSSDGYVNVAEQTLDGVKRVFGPEYGHDSRLKPIAQDVTPGAKHKDCKIVDFKTNPEPLETMKESLMNALNASTTSITAKSTPSPKPETESAETPEDVAVAEHGPEPNSSLLAVSVPHDQQQSETEVHGEGDGSSSDSSPPPTPKPVCSAFSSELPSIKIAVSPPVDQASAKPHSPPQPVSTDNAPDVSCRCTIDLDAVKAKFKDEKADVFKMPPSEVRNRVQHCLTRPMYSHPFWPRPECVAFHTFGKLKSAYAHTHADGLPETTNKVNDVMCTTDYIFYSPTLRLTKRYELVNLWHTNVLMPSEHFGSDHQAIAAEFAM